ncbi:class II glutamine amidotransferase [Amycolatopsis regifaucium]|uniref:Class II glutamine amidotransferase n=1 Tax=Amycolatopsis regifaucium TaxID=546365 RepID=A0A154ML98_9PSEU|nr:class II glutamine amidotransferase [Amycolatopsis regifaucium]KZB84773.1 class II glutamine amidotransferase [Amycolatopsis regifaucium]OKA05242.1 class II glutamine amidotransferase [Amycolatopsis regifaucium]SFJ63425.1 glutamine amidotransferase [Amycolatopsis regifaucium]
MCRLFGLSAGSQRVRATFWLLEAPDSLAEQSRRDPDGTGLGTFSADGVAEVEKQPMAAYEDEKFAEEAKERESATFLAHVRYASTGGLEPRNTHPFTQHGRIFAHNGVLGDLKTLDRALGDYGSLVEGDTDSERLFALITKHIDQRDGDIGAGITSAVRWAEEHLPVYAVNLILTTPTQLWALRYPGTHDLFVLQRAAGGPHHGRHLEHVSRAGRIRARSGALAEHPAVIVASERMDENPAWHNLRSGELMHVDADLTVTRRLILDRPPRHRLTLDDLGAHARASQCTR